DGALLMSEFLRALQDEDLEQCPQDESLVTLAPKLKREAASIDWKRRDSVIANQIRGMYPWPGCRVRLVEDGKEIGRVTLCRAQPADAKWQRATPGVVDDRDHVGAAEGGAVEIVEV